MRAIVLDGPCPPAELTTRQVGAPVAAGGEALLRLAASAVNRSDVLNAIGLPITTFPRIPGRDFAGIVEEGPAEMVGGRYFGTGSGDLGFTRDGSHADQMVVPVEALVPVPAGLSWAEAGAAGLAYAVAADGLAIAGLEGPGQTILVTGAAGGVGAAVAAVARWRGAELIAAVLDDDERSLVLGAHPDATVVTAAEPLPEAVADRTGGAGVDIVFDTVGNPVFADAIAALGNGGKVVVITAKPNADVPFDLFGFYRRGATLMTANSTRQDSTWSASLLREVLPGLESGALPPPRIAAEYPLESCAEAYEIVMQGAAGRVVFRFETEEGNDAG
jgi:NADPH:quinone reductase